MGIVVAVLLLALGVSDQLITKEYLLSDRVEEKRLRTFLKGVQTSGGVAKFLSKKGLDDDEAGSYLISPLCYATPPHLSPRQRR